MKKMKKKASVELIDLSTLFEQHHDTELFSSEEDSSLYFTYSGGCNELEVNNLHYEVADEWLLCSHTLSSVDLTCCNLFIYGPVCTLCAVKLSWYWNF